VRDTLMRQKDPSTSAIYEAISGLVPTVWLKEQILQALDNASLGHTAASCYHRYFRRLVLCFEITASYPDPKWGEMSRDRSLTLSR
jgi:hypothetical protein